jgi:hypothetical protein
MELNDLFVCSLSGVEAGDEDILPDDLADDLGLLPVGWTRITIERRLPSQDWREVQRVKVAMAEAAAQQLPEKQRVPEAVRAIQIQVAAQFAALEATMTPFSNPKEVIFLAPPELDPALAREFFDIRGRLGLAVPDPEEDEAEEEKGEEANAEG